MSEGLNSECPCTWDCERHGKCSECQAYHREHGGLTCCGK
jgi:hypothetical protein